jgi:cytochrome c
MRNTTAPALLRRFSLILASIVAWLNIPATANHAADSVDQSRFERISVAKDLVQPMEFDIAHDGTIFLIELAGKLKTINPTTGESQVVGEISVTTAQENGLIGLALAPDFDKSGWIYLQYSPPDYPGQRISRFQFAEGALQLSSEQRLLEYEEQRRECCHHAGSLEFGPDGCLFIGTGDNTNPFDFSEGYAPIDQRPGREPWDAQRTSANTRSYNGKVLRIRPNPEGGYSIPDGNLFPKDGSKGHPEIYVMGCRNPWRISVDQHTGYLYWGDVGPDAGGDGPRGPRGYDEVNQARQAGFFGWPYFIGDNYAYNVYDFESKTIGAAFDPLHPLNHSVNNTGANELPPAQPAFMYYPAGPSDKFPEVGSGGRTACAGPVYYEQDYRDSNNRLPAQFDRTLFAFEWSRNWIVAVQLDEDSRIKRLERFLPDQKFTRPIQLKIDKAGSLYVLLYGETWGVNADAELIRIDYVRGNRTPKAELTLDRTAGRFPLTIQLNGQLSKDRDSDPLSFRFSYALANSSADSPAPVEQIIAADAAVCSHTFSEPGIYTVHLDVTDPSGASNRQSANVIVGNEPPAVKFVLPADHGFFDLGQKIAYEVEINDFEDGTSNYAAIDDTNALTELDPSAVVRVFVQLAPVGLDGTPVGDQNAPPGLKLIRQSGCLNCHALQRPLVGPAFVEVAAKYRDQEGAKDKSIERVQKGSTGVWGKVPMLPHSHRTLDEIQSMVDFVYTVQPASDTSSAIGLRNELEVPAGSSAIRIEASYTDAGKDGLPALTGSSSLILRQRKIQAEHAAEYRETQPLASAKAEGGFFMGAINHNGYLKLSQIPISQVGGVRISVASAGAGGRIELRAGERNGNVLASIPVEVNENWEEFYQRESAIDSRLAGIESLDVYAVFINEQNGGGLMNVDWIEFLPNDYRVNSPTTHGDPAK